MSPTSLPAISLDEIQSHISRYDTRIKLTLRGRSPVAQRQRADLTLMRNSWQELFDTLVDRRNNDN